MASRRSQPVRQTRVNGNRRFSGAFLPEHLNNELPSESGADHAIDIFPAVTHFTDAITALPKELVRHFTLLKEVNAKIYTPEETLSQLVHQCLNHTTLPSSEDPSQTESSSASPTTPSAPFTLPSDEKYQAMVYGKANMERRQIFLNTASQINNMLVALEEKNHVIATANEALDRHLARIDNVWPHVENEFSDEAKWGSETHWAYIDNRTRQTQPERNSRRDPTNTTSHNHNINSTHNASSGSNNGTTGVPTNHNATPAGSESRKTTSSKKSARNQQDEAEKPTTTKGRKTTTTEAHAASESKTNGSSKRRKVERNQNATTPNNTKPKISAPITASTANTATSTTTPTTATRDTPVSESTKKRKAPATNSSQSKKKTNTSAASSPTVGNPSEAKFPDLGPIPRNRPSTSRVTQNSLSTVDLDMLAIKKAAAASAALTTGTSASSSTRDNSTGGVGAVGDGKKRGKNDVSDSIEKLDEATDKEDTFQTPTLATPEADLSQLPTIPTTTTKSGRTSKPSTPAQAALQETAISRQRSARSVEPHHGTPAHNGVTSNKRKRTAPRSRSGNNVDGRVGSYIDSDGENDDRGIGREVDIIHEDDEEEEEGEEEDDDDHNEAEEDEEYDDGNEPRYCYCNGVSYGAMIACDAAGCESEWFHLECTGLKTVPKSNVKWYCDTCREHMKANNKKNGR